MKKKIPLEELLRWRLAHAEAEAAAGPRAAQLLKLARPWWEKHPEVFQSLMAQLSKIQIVAAAAITGQNQGRYRCAVPALVVSGKQTSKSIARVLDFNIHNDQLRFRFQLEPALAPTAPTFEVTFVSDTVAAPLFYAFATASLDGNCLVDTEISVELARSWRQLEEVESLPFRLILRFTTQG